MKQSMTNTKHAEADSVHRAKGGKARNRRLQVGLIRPGIEEGKGYAATFGQTSAYLLYRLKALPRRFVTQPYLSIKFDATRKLSSHSATFFHHRRQMSNNMRYGPPPFIARCGCGIMRNKHYRLVGCVGDL